MRRIQEELSEGGYRLSGGALIRYEAGGWRDTQGHEYTAVRAGGRLIAFAQRDTLDAVDKEILRKSPEGAAYVRYNELIGGECIGLSVANGYPMRVQEYLERGGTLEGLYEECIEAGITWCERLGVYPIEPSEIGEPLPNDMEYEEIHWYKNRATDLIWWLDTPDRVGEWIFSFDRITVYNMYSDYPHKLTAKQRAIFDRENPEWAEYFKDRTESSQEGG